MKYLIILTALITSFSVNSVDCILCYSCSSCNTNLITVNCTVGSCEVNPFLFFFCILLIFIIFSRFKTDILTVNLVVSTLTYVSKGCSTSCTSSTSSYLSTSLSTACCTSSYCNNQQKLGYSSGVIMLIMMILLFFLV
jgi:hypothetical protein